MRHVTRIKSVRAAGKYLTPYSTLSFNDGSELSIIKEGSEGINETLSITKEESEGISQTPTQCSIKSSQNV